MDSNKQAFLYSFLVGLFACFLVYTYVSHKEHELEKKYGERVVVLVARKDIEEMDQVLRDMVDQQEVPKMFVQPGAILASEMNAFFERATGPIAGSPIKAGEQITDTKITYDGPRSGLAKKINVGMRAIAIPVNDQYGIGKLVKPGDRVDVLSPVRYTEGEIDRVEIKTVLQNVLVLATGEHVAFDPPRIIETDPFSGKNQAKSLTRDRNFGTVTLEVTPYQAQKVTFLATQQGVLYLTLRNPIDQDINNQIQTTRQEDVLEGNSQMVRDQRLRAPASGGR